MSHAFDGHSFEHVLADCERLLVGAADHEYRFSSLLGVLEAHGHIGAGVAADLQTPMDSHAVSEPSSSVAAAEVLSTVRHMCVAAREQLELIESIVARLVGDLAPIQTTAGGNRVLVVDDSRDNREMAAEVLEANGFDAITASDGLEGVIVAHYARPVVVIMDLTMPILDGIEGARLLKASAVTRHLNVIAYTAKPSAIEGPLARLFAHVLTKPTEPALIVASVRNFLVPWPQRSNGSAPPTCA
jgi:CheY-like chemotaxis protein